MKTLALWCFFIILGPLAAGQLINATPLVGEDWYGLYMNGKKAGYSKNSLTVAEDGSVTVSEDARFKLTMVGRRQDMRVISSRTYSAGQTLVRAEARVEDVSGPTTFLAVVDGGVLRFTSTVGGHTQSVEMAAPNETLGDIVSQAQLVLESPTMGRSISFRYFEPSYQQEIQGRSEIVGIEERIFDGVVAKVFKIRTVLTTLGIESVAYVTAEGVTLEDQLAGGILTMRLEPEAVAKDIGYTNDVIVSNAAKVESPIENPRGRKELTLRLEGPLQDSHLLRDGRQTLERDGKSFRFVGRKRAVQELTRAALPIEDAHLSEYRAPSLFVQSDHPKLVAQAKAITGGERDAFRISERLMHWVHQNMRTTYSARMTNSLEVLEHMEGDCTEHSMLFIGLARAAGLPAREAAGLIYVASPEPGFYFHQWASVWVGEWIDVDPTFNQPIADATHIKLSEGDLLQQARILPVIGQLRVEAVGERSES